MADDKTPAPAAPGSENVNPFAQDLAKDLDVNPFVQDLMRDKQQQGATLGESMADIVRQFPQGVNQGLDDFVNIFNLPRWGTKTARLFGANVENYPRFDVMERFNPGGQFAETVANWIGQHSAPRPPETTAGHISRGVGEMVGSSIVPEAGAVGMAERMAALAPTTTSRALAQTIGEQYATNPTRAVTADVAAMTGAGTAQEIAKENDLGPLGQTVAGMIGAFVPGASFATMGRLRDVNAAARALSNPYARIAAGLGDMSIDELANAVATGNTRINLGNSRFALDVLGEEMVRHGGDAVAARHAAIDRIQNWVLPEAEDRVRDDIIRSLRGNTGRRGRAAQPFDRSIPQAERDSFIDQYITHNGQPPPNLTLAPRPTLDAWINQEAQRRVGSVAADHLARVEAAQAGNNLMFGEYPAVARADYETRLPRAGNITDEEAGARRSVGTQQLLDYIANTGTRPSSIAVRNAIENRGQTLTQNAQERIQALAPGPRPPNQTPAQAAAPPGPGGPNAHTIQDIAEMEEQARDLARADYQAAHDPNTNTTDFAQLHQDIQRAIEQVLQRAAGRSGEQADALREAVEGFYTPRPANIVAQQTVDELRDQVAAARLEYNRLRRLPQEQRPSRDELNAMANNIDEINEALRLARREVQPATQTYVMPTLQQAQDARATVRGIIQKNRQSGRTDIVQALQPFYDRVTAAMAQANPQWARANARWADLNFHEIAARLGDAFAESAGPRFREQMQQFNEMAPEAQDIVRVHFVQKLLDKIENTAKLGGQDNLGKLFTKEHTRNMVRELLGDQAANTLARYVRDANVIAASRDMMKGSPTHIRGQVQGEQDRDLRVVQAAENFNFGEWRKEILNWMVDKWRERRNRVMARALTTPMTDTPRVAENLERMRYAQGLANQYRAPNRLRPGFGPALGNPAQLGNIVSESQGPQENR